MSLSQSLWLADAVPCVDGDRDDLSLGAALARSAAAWPDAEAMVFSCQSGVAETRWSFAELDDRATRLAHALIAAGYRPGERIAIWSPNHPNWIPLQFAIARAGMVLVALNPLYRAAELDYALAAADAVAVFHDDAAGGERMRDIAETVRRTLPSLRALHHIGDDVDRMIAEAGRSGPLPSVQPADLLMIQYTSGTTGLPKATLLPHGPIVTIGARSYRAWGFGPDDRVCHGFPLFHVGGSGNSTPGALVNGATTLPIYIFRAEEALDILEREACTGFIGVPSMLTAMMEADPERRRDLSALRRIVVGGAAVPAAFLARCERHFGVEMLNGYGQTESCGVCATVRPGDPAERKTHSSGLALPGVAMKIVDGDGRVQPCGVPGELCVDGPGRMIGYGDPEHSARAFDADGWLRTGDIATMDAQGYVAIVGRLKEMVIRGGENLYPAEIEAFLLQHPLVGEVAVIGLPDEKYGEELCAVIRPAPGSAPDAEELRAWMRARVSRWKVPRYVAFVDALPVTVSGKVRKHELLPEMTRRFLQTQSD